MVELPFQHAQALNVRQNRALALAAVFQATQLTHMTAMAGQQSIGDSGNFYFELLIKASLNIRPATNNATQTLDFFNQLADISLGLKTLEGCITQPLILHQNLVFRKCRQLNSQCLMQWHYCN
jgi:high frequency lysogenization protein